MKPADNSNLHRDSSAVRRKYLYRKLVMSQGIKMPSRLAMKLVGPDCAFHLYSQHQPATEEKSKDKPST